MRAAYFSSIDEYHARFNHNLYPFVLDADTTLAKTMFETPYSLIFGNEGRGLPDIYQQIGTPIRIEQTDEIDSLNLAISVGVALYKSYTQIK